MKAHIRVFQCISADTLQGHVVLAVVLVPCDNSYCMSLTDHWFLTPVLLTSSESMEAGKTSGIQVIKIMVEIHEHSAKLPCRETLFSYFTALLSLLYTDGLSIVSCLPSCSQGMYVWIAQPCPLANQCVSNAFPFPATAFIDFLPVP